MAVLGYSNLVVSNNEPKIWKYEPRLICTIHPPPLWAMSIWVYIFLVTTDVLVFSSCAPVVCRGSGMAWPQDHLCLLSACHWPGLPALSWAVKSVPSYPLEIKVLSCLSKSPSSLPPPPANTGILQPPGSVTWGEQQHRFGVGELPETGWHEAGCRTGHK